jgi:hypothetical protein
MVIRFRDDTLRRACCDLTYMRQLWGPDVARAVSRRLQQLEAMTTLADLMFLPFDSCEHVGGVFEVVVIDHLALFIERGPDSSQRGAPMTTIIITGIRDRATVAKTS